MLTRTATKFTEDGILTNDNSIEVRFSPKFLLSIRSNNGYYKEKNSLDIKEMKTSYLLPSIPFEQKLKPIRCSLLMRQQTHTQ